MAVDFKFTRVERKIVGMKCESHVVGLSATDGVNSVYIDTETPCGMMVEMCTEAEIIKCLDMCAMTNDWYKTLTDRLAGMAPAPVVQSIGNFDVTVDAAGAATITKD